MARKDVLSRVVAAIEDRDSTQRGCDRRMKVRHITTVIFAQVFLIKLEVGAFRPENHFHERRVVPFVQEIGKSEPEGRNDVEN